MKTQIDKMNSETGWTVSNGSLSAVDIEEYRSSWIHGQLRADLQPSAILEKDLGSGVSVSGLDTLGFTCGAAKWNPGDSLTIKLWNGSDNIEFIVPLETRYRQYPFYIPFPSLTKVQFLTPGSNISTLKLLLTDLVAFRDDFPEDILSSLVDLLKQNVPSLPIVGQVKVNTPAGSKTLAVQNTLKMVEKYTVIQIGSEFHQIESINNIPGLNRTKGFYELVFNENFDGNALLSGATAGQNIFLALPIVTNPKHVEGITPAISLENGFDPDRIPEKSFRYETDICIDTAGTRYWKDSRGFYLWRPVVHGLYRTTQTRAIIRSIYGQLQALSQNVWVNGEKFQVNFGAIEDIQMDDVGELQIPVEIECGEFSWQTQQTLNNQKQTVSPQPVAVL